VHVFKHFSAFLSAVKDKQLAVFPLAEERNAQGVKENETYKNPEEDDQAGKLKNAQVKESGGKDEKSQDRRDDEAGRCEKGKTGTPGIGAKHCVEEDWKEWGKKERVAQ
jgi:hypothetical protein